MNGSVGTLYQGSTDWVEFENLLVNDYFPCADEELLFGSLQMSGAPRCRQSRPGNIDIALIGDSHAEHLFPGFAEALPEYNVVYYTRHGLPSTNSQDFMKVLRKVIDDDSIRIVIISAYWIDRGVPKDLDRVLNQLVMSGKKTYVLEGIPDYPFNARECKFSKSPWLNFGSCDQKTVDFFRKHSSNLKLLRHAISATPSVELLMSAQYFCDKSDCRMTRNGQILYRDTNHLNFNGSRFLIDALLRDYDAIRATLQTETNN